MLMNATIARQDNFMTLIIRWISWTGLSRLSSCASLMFILAASFPANAAISITEAKIAAGRLIVSGTSDLGDTVSLDGYYVTDVTNKSFTFSLVYVPTSCIVSLGAPGTSTPNVRAAIANCAPMPVKALGAWQADRVYQGNDLVERQGVYYVALTNSRQNLNEDPRIAVSFWRAVPLPNATVDQSIIVGARGERGEAGQDGAKGEDGALANMDLNTIKIDLVASSGENGLPKNDWSITSTGSLDVTISKDRRDGFIDLVVPAAKSTHVQSCVLAATSFDTSANHDPARIGQWMVRGEQILIPVSASGATVHIEALLLCPKAK